LEGIPSHSGDCIAWSHVHHPASNFRRAISRHLGSMLLKGMREMPRQFRQKATFGRHTFHLARFSSAKSPGIPIAHFAPSKYSLSRRGRVSLAGTARDRTTGCRSPADPLAFHSSSSFASSLATRLRKFNAASAFFPQRENSLFGMECPATATRFS
jgi:hypothetical protein